MEEKRVDAAQPHQPVMRENKSRKLLQMEAVPARLLTGRPMCGRLSTPRRRPSRRASHSSPAAATSSRTATAGCIVNVASIFEAAAAAAGRVSSAAANSEWGAIGLALSKEASVAANSGHAVVNWRRLAALPGCDGTAPPGWRPDPHRRGGGGSTPPPTFRRLEQLLVVVVRVEHAVEHVLHVLAGALVEVALPLPHAL